MRIEWWAFLVALWISCSLFFAVLEGGWLGVDEETVLAQVLDCSLVTSESLGGKFIGLFNPEWLKAVGQMIILDFPIFYGTWEVIKWLIFVPVSAAVIGTLLMWSANYVKWW